MGPRDRNPGDEHQWAGSGLGGEQATEAETGSGPSSGGSKAVAADDQVVQTSQIRGAEGPVNRGPVIVPVPIDPGPPEPGARTERATEREPARDRGTGHRNAGGGQASQAPSFTRTLLLSGLVGLVFGMAGAWGFWHFFGSKKPDASDQGSASSKNEPSSNDVSRDRLQRAEKARQNALAELHRVQAQQKAAERSEEETKAVLEFFKKTLLSAGRPGGGSLPQAFWAAGKGKDVSLRKAVDVAESKVASVFVDRPLAEASVREMLGLAYLNVGAPSSAVEQYERAVALREAMQGANQPTTASARNQLAIAYRLAGREDSAASLFDRTPNSPSQAAALATRGIMLMFEKKPSRAELSFREALSIRKKLSPDDWTTFDTMSRLGESLLDQNRFDEAEPFLLAGYKGLKQREDAIPTQDRSCLSQAVKRLVRLYEGLGKQDEAATWRETLEQTPENSLAGPPQ